MRRMRNAAKSVFLRRMVLLGAVCLGVAVCLVAACGDKPSGKKNVTTLRFATYSTDSQFKLEKEIIDAFDRANEDIEIQLIYTPFDYYIEKVMTLTIGGDPPDVFWMFPESVPYLASHGALMDMTEMVDNDPTLDKDLYFPNALRLCSYKGRLYGLPRDVCCYFTVYNKDMFDAAGVPYPTPDWTWNDLLEISRKLTKDTNNDGRIDQFGFAWYSFHDVIFQTGNQMLSADGTKCYLGKEEVCDAVQWWADLALKHRVMPRVDESHESTGSDLFIAQRAAISPMGPWMIGPYREQCKFNWDVVSMPKGPDGCKARLLGLPISISPKTKHPEEAYRLVKFLCYSEEAQTLQAKLGIAMPSRKDIALSNAFRGQPIMPPGIDYYLDTMQNGTVVENVFSYYASFKRSYYSMRDVVNMGEKTAREAGREYQAIVERDIAKAQRRNQL